MPVQTYDLKGLNCPLPVLKTRRRLADMPSGSQLLIETTDPMSAIDIPHFCREEGHSLLETLRDGRVYQFLISKT